MATPFVPGHGILQVEFRHTLQNQLIENVMYFQRGDGTDLWGASLAGSLLDNLESWWVTNVLALLSIQVTTTELYATELDSETAPTYSEVVGSSGADGASALPAQNAVVITFRTERRGRSGRGRNYIAGLPVGSYTGGSVDLDFASDIAAAYAQLPDFVSAVHPSAFHCVFSRKQEGAWLSSGEYYPVTAYQVTSRTIRAQRRRQVGVGN